MEKKYLKWYQKIGYGSGDIAGNVVYSYSFCNVLSDRHGWFEHGYHRNIDCTFQSF